MAKRQTRLVGGVGFGGSGEMISVDSLFLGCDLSRKKCMIPRTFTEPEFPEKKCNFSTCPIELSVESPLLSKGRIHKII